ncbi:uncharacterized protein LOC129573400 [Sitodiplosis mosellana]|uniref:uncharacterized protein LOC129573400 n=1 Tax=Sitodiplosis mosellana TaxID=263140 RepID=UPI002444A9A6|nr:uncharacterized protein LOC129573400 [Sitodiplosis mosellana]
MDNERSNFCPKISSKVIACLGIAFSFGLVAFFGFVFMTLGVRLIFAVLIFFSNLVAAFFWFNGLDANRTEFMMASIVCWGLQLELWTSYLFLIVLQNAFEKQYPGLIAVEGTNDVVIYALTVFFFVVYLFIILNYVSIKAPLKRKNPPTNLGWKIAGVAAVWLLTAFSIAQSLLLRSSPIFQHHDIWIKRLVFVLHLTAAITWACGAIKNKWKYLAASLICWFLPLAAFLCALSRELYNEYHTFDRIIVEYHIAVFEVTAIYMVIYVIAILSYCSMKRDFQLQQANGLYIAAPTENRDLNAECTAIASFK